MATKSPSKRSQQVPPGAKDYFMAFQRGGSAVDTKSSRTQDQPPRHTKGMTNDGGAADKTGAVTITLRSAKDDFDEKAEVKVELKNPDAVVEKMLQTLANKFPSESVVTIATNVAPSEDERSSSEATSEPDSKLTGRSPSSSHKSDGLSPLGEGLLEPDKLSGRHYIGDDGECLPELADSKGRPIDRFVRDPKTGGAVPVGPQAYDPTGKPLPNTILGPSGRPIHGIPIPPEGLDPKTGQPRPCYDGIDDTKPWEAVDENGQPLLGYAVDPDDGIIKPVGPPVMGPDNRPIQGVIRDPDGNVVSGIPLKPVPQIADLERQSSGAPSYKPSRSSQTRPKDRRPLPDQESLPRQPSDKIGSRGRSSVSDLPGRSLEEPPSPIKIPAPGYPLEDNTVAVLAVGPDGRPMDGYGQDPRTGRIMPVGKKYSDTTPDVIRGINGAPTEGLPVSPSAWDPTTEQAIPHYLTTDDELVPMPISRDGKLLHGLARDTDGIVKPVGLQMYNPDGSLVPSRVIGADGRPVRGIPLKPHDGFAKINEDALRSRSVTPTDATRPESLEDQEDLPIKYIEVPVIQEKIVHIPKTEYREVEKRVPKYEIETVERVVEVPRIEYIDREVEVPKFEEVTREVKVPQIVDVPKEVIREVKRIETKIVEKVVEVPGQVVEVPKVNYVEQKVSVPNYLDKEVPTVVAQKLEPVVRETTETYPVNCTVTEPRVITVDVFIPKPVRSQFKYMGKGEESHYPVSVPPAQFNALTRRLNQQLEEQHLQPLLVREGAGVPLLPVGERVETVEPVSSDWASAHQPGKLCVKGGDVLPNVNIQETLGLPQPRKREDTVTSGDAYEAPEEESDDETKVSTRSSTPRHHHPRRSHGNRRHHRDEPHHQRTDKESSDRQHRSHRHGHRDTHHRRNRHYEESITATDASIRQDRRRTATSS